MAARSATATSRLHGGAACVTGCIIPPDRDVHDSKMESPQLQFGSVVAERFGMWNIPEGAIQGKYVKDEGLLFTGFPVDITSAMLAP